MTIFGVWCTSCVFWPKLAKLQPFSVENDTQSLKIFKIPDSGKSLTE